MIEDLVVIGSGPAAAIAASAVVRAGYSPLILEEGSWPNGNIQHHSLSEITNYYRQSGVMPVFGKQPVNFIDVSVVGGGSQVNSGIYHCVSSDLFNKVSSLDDSKIDTTVEQIDMQIRDLLQIEETPPGEFSDRLIDSARNIGADAKLLPRWASSKKNTESWTHEHHSATKSIIRPLLNQGLRIRTRVRVMKIEKQFDYWKLKCRALDNDQQLEICSKIVFIAAGALGSPKLLLGSGLSNRAGRIVRFHPMQRYLFAYPKGSYDFRGAVLPVQITEYLPRLTIGCSLSDLGPVNFWHPDLAKSRDRNLFDFISQYVLVVPKFPAHLRHYAGRFFLTHKSAKEDERAIAFGEEILHQWAQFAGSLGEFRNGVINSLHGKSARTRRTSSFTRVISSIHQYGSCPIGDTPEDSVIDPNFQVWGHENLYVCDSSTIPDSIGVNPQGTTCALSLMFAQKFLKLHKT